MPASDQVYQYIQKQGGVFSVLQEPYSSLSVCDKQISQDFLKAILSCDDLSQLFLGGSSIGDKEVEKLLNLKKLNYLELSDTKITDRSIELCAELEKLEKLYLYGTNVSDECIGTFENYPALRVLGIEDTQITMKGVQRLKAMCPRLEIS